MADVASGRTLPVPTYLKDKSAPGRTPGYKYSHDYEGGYVPQAYLPEGRRFYHPTENGLEKRIKERLDYWRAQFEAQQ
jgi:putative ATPase